jgi:hypothetical protein
MAGKVVDVALQNESSRNASIWGLEGQGEAMDMGRKKHTPGRIIHKLQQAHVELGHRAERGGPRWRHGV